MDPIVLEWGCVCIVGAPKVDPQSLVSATAREGRVAEGRGG